MPKQPETCVCGRRKSDHYEVVIRRKAHRSRNCKKFQPATEPGGQLRLMLAPISSSATEEAHPTAGR